MTEAERGWDALNSKQLLHAGPWTIIHKAGKVCIPYDLQPLALKKKLS